jgi:hypothetical protein
MGVTARAAVEAPEGERAPYGAQPRSRWVAQTAYTCLRYINKRRRLLMLRGTWLACAFRRFASLLVRRRFFEWRGGWQSSGAVASREQCDLRVIASVSEAIHMACTRIWIASSLSLLAMTRPYPPLRSETKRGRGTMRSMVERASGD